MKYLRKLYLALTLVPHLLLAFDGSKYGNTLPTLKELQCFADKKPQLVSNSDKLEIENAYVLGILSGLAYYSPEEGFSPEKVNAVANALSFSKVERIEAKVGKVDELNSSNWIISHTSGLWLENETDVVIAIGGTNPKNIRNFITDSQLVPLAFDSFGKVHGGFLNALDIVWKQIKEKIQKLEAGGTKKYIHLTGHSLGASIATLAAARIAGPEIHSDTLKDLYTFGSPHTGLADFEKSFNSLFRSPNKKTHTNLFRFVHQWDVVPRLLGTEAELRKKSKVSLDKLGLKPLLPEYKHVGDFVYFNGEGKFFENDAATKAFSFFGDPTSGITNHDIRFYTEYSYRVLSGEVDSGCLK